MTSAAQQASESTTQQKQLDVETVVPGTSVPAQNLSPKSTTEVVLYHYAIVRRDLPFGVVLAQTVHAAGESVQGMLVPPSTHAVVLAVSDEKSLLDVEAKLLKAGIEIAAIRELDEPYCGQLMTIGVKPQTREKLRKLLGSLPLYK